MARFKPLVRNKFFAMYNSYIRKEGIRYDSPIRSFSLAFGKLKELAEINTETNTALKKWETDGTIFPRSVSETCMQSGIPIAVVSNHQILGGDNIEIAASLEFVFSLKRTDLFLASSQITRRWQNEKEWRTEKEYQQALLTLSKYDIDSEIVKHQIAKFLDRLDDWTTTHAMLKLLNTMEEIEGEKDV